MPIRGRRIIPATTFSTRAPAIRPASLACVTVIAAKAVVADALSTAVSVLGPDEGAKLLKHFDAEAYGVTKAGKVWATPGFPRQNLA